MQRRTRDGASGKRERTEEGEWENYTKWNYAIAPAFKLNSRSHRVPVAVPFDVKLREGGNRNLFRRGASRCHS